MDSGRKIGNYHYIMQQKYYLPASIKKYPKAIATLKSHSGREDIHTLNFMLENCYIYSV